MADASSHLVGLYPGFYRDYVAIRNLSESEKHQKFLNSGKLIGDCSYCKIAPVNRSDADKGLCYLCHEKLQAKIEKASEFESVVHNNLKMLDDPTFSDFKIVFSDGRQLPAHKAVLAANSPVFRRFFLTKGKEMVNFGNFSGFEFDIFRIFLRFIYGRELPATLDDHAKELYELAHFYEIDELKKVCKQNLVSSLSVNNSVELYNFAVLNEISDLEEKSWKLLKR